MASSSTERERDPTRDSESPGVRFIGSTPRDSAASSILGSDGSDRHDIMVRYLYRRCVKAKWLERLPSTEPGVVEGAEDEVSFNLGVALKRADGNYTTYPPLMNPDIVAAVEKLGAAVAFTMSSEITSTLLGQITPLQTRLSLDPRIFVLPIANSVSDIVSEKSIVAKEDYLCLCRMEQMVLVWGDSVEGILAHGSDVETRLLGLVWGSHLPDHGLLQPPRRSHNGHTSLSPSTGSGSRTPIDSTINEKFGVIRDAIEREELGDKIFDPTLEGQEVPKRKLLLTHAVIIGLAMIGVVVVELACAAKLITEWRLDGTMIRFAMAATIPVFATFSLFFMIVIAGSIFQLFAPLSGVQGNSVYYSSKAPKPGRYPNLELPHITIQMPVYKEGLKGVVIPTVTSLLAAVQYYEDRGGTASIYVNDDGMQLVKEDLAEARKAFYELNNIGWCSRPPNNTDKESENYFIRKGQFKKASNMNYCLDFSIRVEDEMLRLFDEKCQERGCTREELSLDDEAELYEKARNTIVERDGGKTWAAGNVLIGEIILIVDSDTRVPEDCLLYAALEMHESPEVALLQHASGILKVVNNVFENGIAYFTDLIYTSIVFAVGNGDCGPFVGHNTFIRWKAIQSISWQEDGITKFWSDSHVSEDFDISLRLQMNHFIVRLATYHDEGFKEGVSLTVYDEIARWEKYAYGCNELVFNPIHQWIYKGPFTRLFLRFCFSNIKVTSKVTIFAYIGTYYAIASAIPLTLANYLIVGWFTDEVDQFYITSWKIFVGMAVVYNLLSPVAYAMLRHRLGKGTFFGALLEGMKWTPMFLLFFGGISYHLLKAILCHFFSINMEWTTTAKELENSGFRAGLDRIVRDFKWMYLVVILPTVSGMIYLALYAPRGWRIMDFAAIVPLANQVGCHALLPFALGLF